ncbi:MAG: tRNA threonylcarbamoyladenosine dehydratase [Oscillospiraceae bacterium]|nr:tRNA threonylcarbamoyladenosine dehydratase [Oscillospiraceae bacterium]
MKNNRFSRSMALIGNSGIEKLKNSAVIVFGVGGVGSYAVEALARAGVGKLTIVDFDKVDITNINRQIIALTSTIGEYKAEVARKRVSDINPDCNVTALCEFVAPENIADFNLEGYNAAIDATDNVTAKLAIACQCHLVGTSLISSMGAGNKLNPLKFKVGDIFETTECPLARVMRRELRKRGIPSLRVVYSTEHPVKVATDIPTNEKTPPPSSISFVPSTAGLLIAAEVVNNMLLNPLKIFK